MRSANKQGFLSQFLSRLRAHLFIGPESTGPSQTFVPFFSLLSPTKVARDRERHRDTIQWYISLLPPSRHAGNVGCAFRISRRSRNHAEAGSLHVGLSCCLYQDIYGSRVSAMEYPSTPGDSASPGAFFNHAEGPKTSLVEQHFTGSLFPTVCSSLSLFGGIKSPPKPDHGSTILLGRRLSFDCYTGGGLF